MSRRKEPPRGLGPTQERGGRTWCVVVVVDGNRTSHFAATEAEARRLGRKLAHDLPSPQNQTVRKVMELYIVQRMKRSRCSAQVSVRNHRQAARDY